MSYLVSKDSVSQYIPQRYPMVMVDNLTSSDENTLTAHTSFFVENSNIFCENGFFKEPGMIENIAQSCALRVGYAFHAKAEKVPLGFIGAVKNLQVHFYPKANSEIQTEIKVMNEIFDVTLVYGKVFSEGKIAAECEMKIFLKKDD
jgi:3-hydroxymyristoyl/3-hydroxydecanoyl-(acyl carrier protein) dehydratase